MKSELAELETENKINDVKNDVKKYVYKYFIES